MGEYTADSIALLFSVLGGFFMGTYPVPIKCPSVLKADPHPIVFQCYKTFWVFLTGWLFVLANVVRGQALIFQFTWWGVVSAAGWIPSGLCTIAAVPRLGVGMAIAVSTATASVLSFLVFWLVLGQNMKEHGRPGHHFYMAPIYLVCVVLGMGGMVSAPKLKPCGRASADEGPLVPASTPASSASELARTRILGFLFAFLAGVFSAVQFGAVNLGKRSAQKSAGCFDHPDTCPAAMKEQFNVVGSWMASFGIGALAVTAVYALLLTSAHWCRGQSTPDFHFSTLRGPGSAAGILWALGSFFQTAAVMRGGDAVMLPANQGIQLVTSGVWGLAYYKEMPDTRRAALWIVSALWTLTAIILLSREKS